MRLVIARCSVDYAGRLSAHLPLATRLLVVKADGSVLVHSDSLSYKPLNWMSPPCTLVTMEPEDEQREAGVIELWRVAQAKTADLLVISIHEILHDSSHELGIDPGLQKDGVEAHLQKLLAEQIALLGDGHRLVRREYMTAIGPVDILARDAGIDRRIEDARLQVLRTVDLEGFLGLRVGHPAALAEGIENRRADVRYELGGRRDRPPELLERVGEGRGDPGGRIDDRAVEVEQDGGVLGH